MTPVLSYQVLARKQSSSPNAETCETESRSPSRNHSSAVGGLSAFLCLPFLWLGRNRPRKLLVGESFTRHASLDSIEAVTVASLTAVVVERFLVNVIGTGGKAQH